PGSHFTTQGEGKVCPVAGGLGVDERPQPSQNRTSKGNAISSPRRIFMCVKWNSRWDVTRQEQTEIAAPSPRNSLFQSQRRVYAAPMSIARKLLHTRYRVNDLDRTVKFYREVLGLEELERHKSPRGSELA